MQYLTHTLLIVSLFVLASCVGSEADNQTTPPPPEKVSAPEVAPPQPPIVEEPVVEKLPVKTPPPPATPPPASKPPVQKVVQKTTQPQATTPPPPPPSQNTSQPVRKVVQQPATPPPPPPQPIKRAGKISFQNKTLNYGYIKQGDVIDHDFVFTNVSNVSVNILNAEASCGCTRPTYTFMPIEPGASAKIGVRFDSKGKLGKMESSVTVLTDAKPAKHHLYLVGTITDPPKKEEKKKDEVKEENQQKEIKETTEKDTTQEETQKKTPFKGRKLPKGIPPGGDKKDGKGN